MSADFRQWPARNQRSRIIVAFPAAAGGATVIDLELATFNFDGSATQNRLTAILTSAVLSFVGQAIQPATRVVLAAATFLFSAQPVTVLAAKLIDLLSATLSLAAQATQNSLVARLTTATFSFVAQTVEVTTGAVVQAVKRFAGLTGFGIGRIGRK